MMHANEYDNYYRSEIHMRRNPSSNQRGRNQLGHSFKDTDAEWRQSPEVAHRRQEHRNTISKLVTHGITNELLRLPPLPSDISDLLESLLFRNSASKDEYMNRETLIQRVEALLNMDVPCNFGSGGGSSYFTQQHTNDLVTDLIKHEDCSVHIQNSKSMGFHGPFELFLKSENPDFMMPPLVSSEISDASAHFTQPNELGVEASFLQSDGGSSYFPQLHAADSGILEAMQPNELVVKPSLPHFGSSFGDDGVHYCQTIEKKTMNPSQLPVSRANDVPSVSTEVVLHPAKRRKKETGFRVSLVNDESFSQPKCLKDQSFPSEKPLEMQQPNASTYSEIKECNMVQLKKKNVNGVVSFPNTFPSDSTKASLPHSGSSFGDEGVHYCQTIEKKTINPSQLPVSRANDVPSVSTEVVLHPAKRRKKETGFRVSLVNDESFSQPKCLKDQSFPSEKPSEMQQPIVSTYSEIKECNMVQLEKKNVNGVVSLPNTFPSDSTKASLPHSGSSFGDEGVHYCQTIEKKTMNPSQLPVSRANDVPSVSTEVVLHPAKRRKKEAGVGVSLAIGDSFSQQKYMSDQSFPTEILSEMQQPIVSTCSEVKECNMVQLKKNNVKDTVSLPDTFTRDQLNEHIMSLRKQNVQSTTKEETGIAANTCRLCTKEKLFMTPTPINCLLCYKRIKKNANYFYRNDEELDAQSFVCSTCFKKSKDGSITVDGRSVRTILFEKKKNNEVDEEHWVECDKCKSWQHQICALYNNKRDLVNSAEYICPLCRIEEIDNEMHVPLPKTAVFGAKDLPRTTLSDHIEKRLIEQLVQERAAKVERNEALDEVLATESLSVREVLSVDKKLNVSKQFLDILPEEEIYPAEFPYRSRVILLFQKIEGADVCIFGMYVQEFGSKCGYPSQRYVYLSYLDSVKYFRPQRESSSGEALRTFVYHQILIGYLDFCKKRGFTTCYIWACPPKGDDYILYCHPKTQKIPKNDQLRHWYLSMLRKAAKENIVVGLTNIYDYFFVTTGKRDSKVSASRLPYFDGDYWSGRAMDLARDIEKESGGDYDKILKKLVTKRALKAMGHTNLSKSNAKDILVMQKLGQIILPSKEDFIVAHLQHPCMHCREVIVSGKRWFCTECKKFQECERCHTADVHTSESGEVHTLCQVSVDIPSSTKENDIILHNKFFEDRNNFLNFCQKNRFQFDTLRRAKYSSMMILDHLKNPITLCLSGNQESKQTSPVMRDYLQAIQHASQCHPTRDKPCSYPCCLQVKKLFSHAHRCTIQASGGCQLCKKVWRGLIAHSRNCEDSKCCTPRCRELKKRQSTISSMNLCA